MLPFREQADPCRPSSTPRRKGHDADLRELLPLVRPGGLILAHNMRRPAPTPKHIEAIASDPNLDSSLLLMEGDGMGMTPKKRRSGATAMHRTTWACFDCRRAVRRSPFLEQVVRCPGCGRPCRSLGSRLRVPSKADARAWRALRDWFRTLHLAELERIAMRRVRTRHNLERRLAALEARPDHPDRSRQLGRLRTRLEAEEN